MMATINKQSLREEFDALKAEFERLIANGTMAAELYQLAPLTPARLPPNKGMKLVRHKKKAEIVIRTKAAQKSRARSTAMSFVSSISLPTGRPLRRW